MDLALHHRAQLAGRHGGVRGSRSCRWKESIPGAENQDLDPMSASVTSSRRLSAHLHGHGPQSILPIRAGHRVSRSSSSSSASGSHSRRLLGPSPSPVRVPHPQQGQPNVQPQITAQLPGQRRTTSPGARPVPEARPRGLPRSGQRLFGAEHHNRFTAVCCLDDHSTKCASCGPPSARSHWSRAEAESHSGALPLDGGTISLSQGCATPASLGPMGGSVLTAGESELTDAH